MKKFVTHDLIKPYTIEQREYQLNIYHQVRKKNALVVFPTGLGKTVVALLVLMDKVKAGKKVLFLAPTKPLCEQHASFIRKSTILNKNDITVVTGETVTPQKRGTLYEESTIIVATPQTILHDLESRINMSKYGVIIFDEAHRAVGDYAYVPLAENYLSRDYAQVLGLTASPGSDFEKLREVIYHLGINHIEIRTEWDEDVRPYLSKRLLKWQLIDMPDDIKRVSESIKIIIYDILPKLYPYSSQARNLTPINLSKKALIDIQQRMKKNLGKRGGSLYHGLALVSAAMKLAHLRDMLTSQGAEVAKNYILKLSADTSKAASIIKKHPLYTEIKQTIQEFHGLQPKLERTKELIKMHLQQNIDARIIVFAEYRDTVEMLLPDISQVIGAKPVRFIGQTRSTEEKGMSQKEQKYTLESFRRGVHNILISTSIGEEGIDIPATSLVIFYEPVPSAIRHIQRKGRTARNGMTGEVHILIMKDSRDEAYYWTSVNKEKKMYSYVYKLKKNLEGKKSTLEKIERQSKISEFIN